ncbi:activating transcription factor 3 [Anthonomus grandis grandis]|uniref:activating transcription factor 3 n=1 Tax=Anthonomus grandis grandis TaxID=2921223 RepID=UPI0021659E2C|nr:activating transcription factor 3 [Anthonomus grandis grandis]XP_050300508.1 activating transcription factor 3 [Anthonomus grandis grandis]
MHNLNVNLAVTAASAASTLLVESGGTTPRTPEILNSLIAMTNPLDNYQFGDDAPKIVSDVPAAASNTSTSSDSNSSSSSQVESPVGNNPPSVQHTCSQLIKAGLKLTIEQKRKQNVHQQAGSDGDDFLDLDTVSRKRFKRNIECSESEEDKIKREPSGLTPEDEERRRRRRERNKIAATKCRLKKRERTANLIHESETLETQNVDLKNQLQELKNQERMLMDVLSSHRPQCQHNIGPATKESLYKLPPVSSVMEQHSYSRPSSVNPLYRNQNPEIYTRPNQITVSSHQLTYTRSTLNFSKPPSIVVEEMEDYDSQQFINLDSINPYYASSPCNYTGGASQGYGNSQGMDNGCMA